MAKDYRQMNKDFGAGMQGMGKANPEFMGTFGKLHGASGKGALDAKTKELMTLAIAVHCRCEYCIVYHVQKSLELGATRDEILETAYVAAIMGGGPVIAYASTALLGALNEFEKDFQ